MIQLLMFSSFSKYPTGTFCTGLAIRICKDIESANCLNNEANKYVSTQFGTNLCMFYPTY